MEGEILRWSAVVLVARKAKTKGDKDNALEISSSLAFPWKEGRECSTCLVQGPGAGRYAMGRGSGAGCCTHARTAALTDAGGFFLVGAAEGTRAHVALGAVGAAAKRWILRPRDSMVLPSQRLVVPSPHGPLANHG